jgi:hypothetical protein
MRLYGPGLILDGLKVMWYSFLRRRLLRTTYGMDGLHLQWWVATVMYLLLILEFIIMAILSHNLTTGIFIGLAVGEIGCRLVDNLGGAFDEVITTVKAEILNIKEVGFTLTRLFETDTKSFGLLSNELDIIANMFDEFYPGTEGEKNALDVLIYQDTRLEYIYITDRNEMIYLWDWAPSTPRSHSYRLISHR